MQHGLGWHGGQLRKRVLHDKRLHIYPGGRADIRGRRVDPRVLITVEYLANATGSVRVSSLVSGHRLFTASGGVSAHVYGRAVDVTAVGGVRIKNHQGPGSVTERTVRLLLLLPQRMRPRQVVSLMDVDGPTGNHGSFALPDHSEPHPDRVLRARVAGSDRRAAGPSHFLSDLGQRRTRTSTARCTDLPPARTRACTRITTASASRPGARPGCAAARCRCRCAP